jgi:hypothetical protein
VPEQERGDDAGDEREDEVGLAEVTALETTRALDLPDRERGHDADQDERDEHVDEELEPALALEPEERRLRREHGVAIDDPDDRQQDGGEEHEEAPEDEGVHEARPEALQELPLAEDDRRLVARAPLEIVEAIDGLPHADEAHEEEHSAPGEPAARHDGRGKGDGRDCGAYCPRAFRSSALTAGTTSCRSPITA